MAFFSLQDLIKNRESLRDFSTSPEDLESVIANATEYELIESIRLVNFKIEGQPNDPLLHFILGVLNFQIQDASESREAFENSLLLDANFSLAYEYLGTVFRTAFRPYNLAEYYFEKAIEINPDVSSHWVALAQYLLSLIPENDRCIEAAKTAITIDDKNEHSWSLLGYALLINTSIVENQNHLIDDRSQYSEMTLTDLRSKNHDRFQEGISALKKAIECSIGYSPSHLVLASALFVDGSLSEAEKYCQQYLSIYPRDVNGLRVLASIYLANSEYDKAKQGTLRGLEVEPDNVDLLYTSAIIYAKENIYLSRSIHYFESCLELLPEYHIARYYLVEVLLKEGMIPKAIETAKKGLLFSGNFQYVHHFSLVKSYWIMANDSTFPVVDNDLICHINKCLTIEKPFIAQTNLLLEVAQIIREISRRLKCPFLLSRIDNVLSQGQNLSFLSNLTNNTKMLLSMAEMQNDRLSKAILFLFGGDYISSYQLLDSTETMEEGSDYRYQYYLYQSGYSFFHAESESILKGAIESILKCEWGEEKDHLQKYYALLLLVRASMDYSQQFSFDVRQFLKISKDDFYSELLIQQYEFLNGKKFNNQGLEKWLIHERERSEISGVAFSTLTSSDSNDRNKLTSRFQSFLRINESLMLINEQNIDSLFDANNDEDKKTLLKLQRELMLYNPLEEWVVSDEMRRDVLHNMHVEKKSWIEEIIKYLEVHPKLFVLLHYRAEDITGKIIASKMESLLNDDKSLKAFQMLIDYYRLEGYITYQERILLWIYSSVCLERSRVFSLNESWVKSIFSGISGFCLKNVSEIILESSGFIDSTWNSDLSDRLYSYLRKACEDNSLRSIVYSNLKDAIDKINK